MSANENRSTADENPVSGHRTGHGRCPPGISGFGRCRWAQGHGPAYLAYHDREWGVPQHQDRVLFEFLVLESAQAGLAWATILQKREGYRRAFTDFDPARVARFGQRDVERLLEDRSIVRNRLKIEAAIGNARAFLRIQESFGSFDAYVWRFTGGRVMQNAWSRHEDVPARTPESAALSRDLRQRGFRFMGEVIVYAHMQATGMVNDHTVDCFRWRELGGG